jgi:hypothetical protein
MQNLGKTIMNTAQPKVVFNHIQSQVGYLLLVTTIHQLQQQQVGNKI